MMMDVECIEMMVKHGVYLIPTIIAATKIIKMGSAGGLTKETVEKAMMCIEHHGKDKKCRKAGVKIVAGTDAVAAEVSPWYDITSMEKISFVMKVGNVYKYEP